MDMVDAKPSLPTPSHSTPMDCDDGDDYAYDMTHKRRGTAIIINNRDFHPRTGMGKRSGTDRDAASMYQMFKGLGFEASLTTNLTTTTMHEKLKEVAHRDHRDSDCVAVAILTHGEENGMVYGTDGPVPLKHLLAHFKSDECRGLAGKPKLFFIQACRGNEMDRGTVQSDASVPQDDEEKTFKPPKLPQEADVLVAYSTVEGHYSWRNADRGSFFIQTLCKMMSKFSKSLELQQILLRVNNEVAKGFESTTAEPAMTGMKQMPSIENQLRKELYFTPK